MQATSFVIPYRAGQAPERRINLDTVLAWVRRQGPAEIIVVEQDSAPTLGDLVAVPGLRVVFTFSVGPFNKSWAMNVGARVSTGSLVVFGDADVVCPGLPKAIAGARQGIPVVRPFNKVIDLSEDETAMVRADFAHLSDPGFGRGGATREDSGEFPPLCGGMVVFQRGIISLVGGWDERFEGWGGEDDAMDHKLSRAGIRPGVLGDVAGFHLHHRRHSALPTRDLTYRNNLALLAQLRAMPDEALRRMCEVSQQIMGNPDMYRPLEPLE